MADSGWGSGWGEGNPDRMPLPDNDFEVDVYEVPKNILLGKIPISSFMGEPMIGPLSGSNGSIYFSPSFLQQNNTNEIDLDFIGYNAVSSDAYERPEESDSRLFRFSNTGTYKTNSTLYKTQPKEYSVVAVMVQTIPPGPTTTYKIP